MRQAAVGIGLIAHVEARVDWVVYLLTGFDVLQDVHGLVAHLRVVAQFRSGHGPIPVLFECYRIRTDSGMPRLDIRFSTSHLMMASTR